MISRAISSSIQKHLKDEKAIILLGPRQVGKSTLLQQLSSKFAQPVMWWNGDDTDIRTILSNTTSTLLRSLLGKSKTLIIDEAQRIDNIGI